MDSLDLDKEFIKKYFFTQILLRNVYDIVHGGCTLNEAAISM